MIQFTAYAEPAAYDIAEQMLDEPEDAADVLAAFGERLYRVSDDREALLCAVRCLPENEQAHIRKLAADLLMACEGAE